MIFAFLNASVFALLLQNLVFDGGFGMSEAIRIATKPKEFLPIAFTVAFFTSMTAAICSTLDLIPAVHDLTTAYHLLIYCAVLAAVYLGFTALIRYGLKMKNEAIHRIGMAAVNTLVLAVPMINRRAAFGVLESVGVGLGAGLAFVLAVLLIGQGQERLSENESVPDAFRGKPALFLYIALISLGFVGMSGQALFV
ncbi:MAG: hypothetical protein IJU96_07045 [Clostridia bacterium]|nr:hypothetical protein [Clostridia bacterium]